MNVQQLNQTSQQLRDFVITAVSATAITGALWLITARINYARQWMPTGCKLRISESKPSYP